MSQNLLATTTGKLISTKRELECAFNDVEINITFVKIEKNSFCCSNVSKLKTP